MRYRRPALTALAGTLVVLAIVSGPGQELTGELGLTHDPPAAFTATLAGALFEARTLRDDEGAPDIGYLVADAPLTASVLAATGGVARIRLQVDGRVQRTVTVRCPGPASQLISVDGSGAPPARG